MKRMLPVLFWGEPPAPLPRCLAIYLDAPACVGSTCVLKKVGRGLLAWRLQAYSFGALFPVFTGALSRMARIAGTLSAKATVRNQPGAMGSPTEWITLASTNWVAPPKMEMAKA